MQFKLIDYNPITKVLQFNISNAEANEIDFLHMYNTPVKERLPWEIEAWDAEGKVDLTGDIYAYTNLNWTVQIDPDQTTINDFLKYLKASLASGFASGNFKFFDRENFNEFCSSLSVDPATLDLEIPPDIVEEEAAFFSSENKLTPITSISSTAQIASTMTMSPRIYNEQKKPLSPAIALVEESLNESIIKLTTQYKLKDTWVTPSGGQALLADLMVDDIRSLIRALAHIQSPAELEKLLDDFEKEHSAELKGRPNINEIKHKIAQLPEQIRYLDLTGYEKLSCKDARGKTQHFLVQPQKKEGGEATIYFGYRLDTKDKIIGEKIAIRKFKFKTNPAEVDLEIKATQILYNTSNRLIFETADGGIETYGFATEVLPGKDFMKKRENNYTSILIHKGDEEKINQLEFKDDQLVLSNDKIYWREDGKIASHSMEDIKLNNIMLHGDLANIFTSSAQGSLIEDTALIKRIKIQTKCTAKTGLDESEFEKLNLSFLQRCQILKDIFEQLSQLHKAKFFHGDINPANIKIYLDKEKNAHAKLFDFGQSRFLGESISLPNPVVGMLQDFIPPETVGNYSEYSPRSDIFSMAGIMGMIFSKHPNLFIQSRLAKSRELEKSGAGYSEVVEALANEKYDINAMFNDVNFQVADDIKIKLQTLIQLMTNTIPAGRPSSEKIFNIFDEIVTKELEKKETLKSLMDQTLNEMNTRSDIIMLGPMKDDFMNQCNLIIHSENSEAEEQLKSVCNRFKEYCNIAYQFRSVSDIQPDIIEAYKRGDKADRFRAEKFSEEKIVEKIVKSSSVIAHKEEKTVNKDLLKKAKTGCIRIINNADNIGIVLAAIKEWATYASVYQTTKKSSIGGRFLGKGFTSKKKGENLKKAITVLVADIVKSNGDMSKKIPGNDSTLEERFHHLKVHDPDSTVIKQLDEILIASRIKLDHFLRPTSPRNPSSPR